MSKQQDKIEVLVKIEAPDIDGKISFDYKYRGVTEGHAAGLLLQTYINAATDFLAGHRPDSQLYQTHKEMLGSAHATINALKMKI